MVYRRRTGRRIRSALPFMTRRPGTVNTLPFRMKRPAKVAAAAQRRFNQVRAASAPRKYRKESGTGGYNQWTRIKKTTGKRVSAAVLDRRLVRANREYEIYGFRQVKRFDDHGAIPIHSAIEGTLYKQPVHVHLLNGHINDEPFKPVRALYFDDTTNSWKWSSITGLEPSGGSDPYIQMIKRSEPGDTANRRYHEYSHVKMNVWGAKSKPTRWQIDVVQPLSDEVNPWHWGETQTMNTAAMQAWEEMVKQWTFNPISKMDHYIKKNFKTIKSMSFIIDPISVTEQDQDPHVKTIDWFMRVNKMVNFDKLTINSNGKYTLDDPNDLKTAVDHTVRTVSDTSEYPRDKQCLLLLIRCSDYTEPSEVFTNDKHGSYDIDWRTKLTTLG